MKNILAVLLMAISASAFANSITESATETASLSISNRCEQSRNGDRHSSGRSLETMLLAINDIGQCMGDCASEQGICISQCENSSQCIANCAAAHGRCVARCN